MRLAYADPPYPGLSAKHYAAHPDYAGEVDHDELLRRLVTYDGWVLHTHLPALPQILRTLEIIGTSYRIAAWVKTFCAFRMNVSPAYAWEPVLFHPARKARTPNPEGIMRDWIAEPMTMQRGLVGAKPTRVCRWAFQLVGAHVDDQLDDLYPGTGAVTRAWRDFCGDYTSDDLTLF